MAVLINAGSGSVGDADLAAQVSERFSARGINVESCRCAQGPDILRYAEEAMRRGCTTVVAGGGDGTVSTIASVVAGTEAALGVLPLGTLNHFAKDAGIPLDLDEAVAAVVEGYTVLLDVGEVNGRPFINNSSLGLYPLIVGHREAQQRLGRSKWWAFFKAVLAALGRYPLLQVRYSADEARMLRTTPFLFIGNNEYEIHGLNIGTRARLDSGELSVYMTHSIGRSGLISLALRGLVGRLRESRDFDSLRTREAEVHVRGRHVRVALDGEVVVMAPPLLYRCRSRCLRVIVPKKTE